MEIPQSDLPLPLPRNASLAGNFMNVCETCIWGAAARTSLHPHTLLLSKQTFGMSPSFIPVLPGEKFLRITKTATVDACYFMCGARENGGRRGAKDVEFAICFAIDSVS
ncbi:hypothetical protein CEXT_42841 [Caerostris extrusa]|uniref:Uncharacterized protein n=1 Tax=Caerostris extrusa TaxID=172846 RepID=A0AAV4TUP1_CAEEX|nr:hypothetical protein CEXT_42841 [Caerostris extrusa]